MCCCCDLFNNDAIMKWEPLTQKIRGSRYIDLTAPTVAAGKNWKKIEEQEGFNGMQMVQFECPRHSNPTLSFNFETCRMTPFLLLAVSGNKKWAPIKKVKN